MSFAGGLDVRGGSKRASRLTSMALFTIGIDATLTLSVFRSALRHLFWMSIHPLPQVSEAHTPGYCDLLVACTEDSN